MSISSSIHQHLNRVGVQYDVLPHPHSHNSLQTARLAHIPAGQMVKGVLTENEGNYLLCVVPSTHQLVLAWLNSHMHGNFKLVNEEQLGLVFDDCEMGAVPALGQVYGLHVVWDDCLAEMQDFYFESGDHENLIHVNRGGFMELMGGQEHMTISCLKEEYTDYMHH